jgi:hypothetical protein
MKPVTLGLILMFASTEAFACKIFNQAYGGSPIGRVEGGKIFSQAYGGSPIGRVEDGKIFNQAYGGSPVGRGEGCGMMSLGGAALLLL